MVAVSGMYICLWTHLAGVAGFGLAVDSKRKTGALQRKTCEMLFIR